jgi:hypothetical protein
MRIHTHEIDTQARKIVPIALPRQWEYRDVTGRDYGIDMELEIFEEKEATGQVLLFQIKGTEKEIVFKDGISSFDIPTKMLIYSNRFITPFILSVCPIQNEKQIFYYIWLQEYIKCVLNFDNPSWRNNKSTTRIKLLEENVMPGNEQKLSYISHFPQRLYGVCEVARILHNLRYKLDGEACSWNFKDVAKDLKSVENIPGFLNKQWKYGEYIQRQYLNPAIIAAQILANGKEPTKEELKLLPLLAGFDDSKKSDWINKKELLDFQLKSQVSQSLECMSFYYEETNYALKNFFWNEEHAHTF